MAAENLLDARKRSGFLATQTPIEPHRNSSNADSVILTICSRVWASDQQGKEVGRIPRLVGQRSRQVLMIQKHEC